MVFGHNLRVNDAPLLVASILHDLDVKHKQVWYCRSRAEDPNEDYDQFGLKLRITSSKWPSYPSIPIQSDHHKSKYTGIDAQVLRR